MNLQTDHLEDWLAAHRTGMEPGKLLDVGAYRGDFSLACLERGLVANAELFEPNPENHPHLEQLCAERPSLALHGMAVGATAGERDFYCTKDTATGSVLPYNQTEDANNARLSKVTMQPLDQWWQAQQRPAVAILKVDTQGHDLEVLQSARALIAENRPWVIVEMIFSRLYDRQARPAELLTWAESARYDLAGLFNEHRTEAGILAFADAVLLPREAVPPPTDRFPVRPATVTLEEEIAQLRAVCAERLSLIEYLHAEAQRRLERIQELSRSDNQG